MRYFVPVAILAALIVLFAVGLRRGDPSRIPSPLIGKPAPAFSLPTLDGGTLAAAQLAGKPVLVNFFASWCTGCLDEHSVLLELSQAGVPIIGMDYKDTPGDVAEWLSRHGNPYAKIVQDAAGTAGLDWGVYGVPETFVLDANGIIRFKQIGPMTHEVFANQIAPLLKAPS